VSPQSFLEEWLELEGKLVERAGLVEAGHQLGKADRQVEKAVQQH